MTEGNREQRMVAAFHRAMQIPAAIEPIMLTAERAELRYQLIEEEAREFREASERGDWLEMVDALVDLLYVTYGTAVAMGVDLAPFFNEVHDANMQKEPGPEGGKSVKPDGWIGPDLARVYEHAYPDTPLPTRH